MKIELDRVTLLKLSLPSTTYEARQDGWRVTLDLVDDPAYPVRAELTMARGTSTVEVFRRAPDSRHEPD